MTAPTEHTHPPTKHRRRPFVHAHLRGHIAHDHMTGPARNHGPAR